MAAREVKRTLTVTADTSGLRKGAQDIQQFGQGVDGAAAYLKRMRAELSATDYRSLAAGLKPVIAAEKEMAAMAREAERALKPFAAEMRKTQLEALKAAETLNNRRLSEARAAEALRKTYDTGYRNAQAYLRVEEQVARQIEARNLTVEQGATVLQGAATRFKHFGTEAGAANQNVKLAAHEMVNLSRQGQDVVTMFAMGMSPMQVFTSQAAQVYDAISSGEGGLAGGFQRLGNSVKAGLASLAAFAVSPVGIATALGAATAAAIYFATRSDRGVKTATEALERYKGLVDSLDGSYRSAGDAATRYFNQAKGEGASVAAAAIQGTAAEIKATLARELDELYPKTQGFVTSFAKLTPEVLKGQDAIRALGDKLKSGELTAAQFREQIAKVRTDPQTAPEVVKIADGLMTASVNARDLANALGAVGAAAADVSGKTGRVKPGDANPLDLRDRFGGVTGTLGKLDPAAMDGFRDQLRGQREGLEAYTDAAKAAQSALRNFDLSPVDRQLADTAQTYDQRIAAYKRATTDTIGLAALQAEKEAALALISKEATRSEETRRAGYALDLKAVGDITAAQKAATAGQRAFNDAIGQGYDRSYAAARSAEASALAMAQARQQASQAATEQARATQRQIEQAQFEYNVVGKSAGEVARLRAEFDLLAQAKDAARSAGFDEETVTLTDSMRDHAAQIGRLTEATQRLNFERDLLFDRQQTTRSPEDQRIADQLRSIGVEFESAQGKADAAQLRLNNRLHEANDRLYEMRDAGKKAFGDLISSIGDGEGAIDSIAKAFAGLGQQLASAGFDRLFGNLFGDKSGDAKRGGLAGLLGQIGTTAPRIAANTNAGDATGYVPTPTARPTDFGQAAAVSGQVMTYAKRFNSGVDTRLMAILKEASANFPMRVEAMSGLRPGDPRFHGKGLATDVRIFDASGKALSNYQDGSSFRVYEQFAQQAKIAQEKLFPELGKLFRWGGYFSGAKGRYGALDTMHFDLGGAGMAGGSWENGLTPAMRRIWGGAESIGMGSRTADQRVVAQGVSQGMMDYSRHVGPEGYGGGRFDDAGADSLPQMTRGQAGFGALTGLLGIAGAGYQSGNILSGGLSGLMGGAELASQFGGALGLGSAAGPIGMGVGAAVGIISSPLGKRGPATRADMRRRFAAYQAQKGNGRDSDQCVSAA